MRVYSGRFIQEITLEAVSTVKWAIAAIAVACICCMAFAQTTQPSAARPAGESTAADLPEDALRLVLTYFDIVRDTSDDEYAANKNELARNLLRNIIPFLTPSKPATPPKPVAPPAPRPAAQRQPSGQQPATARRPKPPQAPVRPTVSVPKPSEVIPPGHENDPAYARVPQKLRIRSKFKAAEAPFKKMRTENPERARLAGELLSAARTAFAKGDFDRAESYIDRALEVLGVKWSGK